jgi:hypothetical protein
MVGKYNAGATLAIHDLGTVKAMAAFSEVDNVATEVAEWVKDMYGTVDVNMARPERTRQNVNPAGLDVMGITGTPEQKEKRS